MLSLLYNIVIHIWIWLLHSGIVWYKIILVHGVSHIIQAQVSYVVEDLLRQLNHAIIYYIFLIMMVPG